MADRIVARCDRVHFSRVSTPLTFSLSHRQTLQITNSGNKKTHSATVVDLCTGCGEGSLGEPRPLLVPPALVLIAPFSRLDMSPSLFEALDGSLDYGTFLMTWAYS